MKRIDTVSHNPRPARQHGGLSARPGRFTAALAAAIVGMVAIVGSVAAPAYADYPSWSDVQKAKAN
ncbi:hypothetical protein [Leifsonia poae]|uniref:Uncharacterized protein n=1 Tax=Leifsonia poae TaxID=110933 RepID=A0A9W6LYY3_9MICO|nr:hypothetical protein [Leifsonia poae]GLJ75345.1 hypothetical protein GCM10017584_09190 [Leifsonia poae]